MDSLSGGGGRDHCRANAKNDKRRPVRHSTGIDKISPSNIGSIKLTQTSEESGISGWEKKCEELSSDSLLVLRLESIKTENLFQVYGRVVDSFDHHHLIQTKARCP